MELNFKITAVTQVLENDIFLTQALFFSEILRFETNITRAENALITCAKYVLSDLSLVDIHRRHSSPTIIKEVCFSLAPLKDSIGWKEPVNLIFNTLEWTIDDVDIVYVPTLGIEILNREKDREKLPEKVISEIKAEILRRKAAGSLKNLSYLQRSQTIKTSELSFNIHINTPKQIAINLEKPKETASVLKEIGTYLNSEKLPIAYEVEEETQLLADSLIGRSARSVLLVGDSGVGKTAIFYNLVKHRLKYHLASTPFWATSGAKLVAGMSGFGMWQERCQQVWQEANKQKAILFFANLVELMQVGKSVHNSQGIASFFRPYLVRGDLIVVAECTPEQLPLIEKEDPHLLDAFQIIRINPPDINKGRSILLSYALDARRNRTVISLETLERLDQLHRRYATYSAYPGRPLRFLKNLISDLHPDLQLNEKDVIEAFSRETGLPLFILDDEVKLDLTYTYEWFSKRVIGQNEAVNLVVDMLAMVKTRLARVTKPIASFLFIGPTGVGKTEMAKSLAEFLFQDKGRLSRFDMSEYSDPFSVKRLIGGVFGSEGLLTAKVREQPFSVILFDEFEKAHPLFFDLLLQVLGEGRLTDSAGRLADFRNSVIIMTSNLGAEAFQKGALGFQTDDLANASKYFASAVKDFLRPELFNRIDRIVPFAPLASDIIYKIATKELENLSFRNGLKYRNITLEYSKDVIAYLAEKGYSPRYGARPLKRAIERQLLVPISERLNNNNYATNSALAIEISLNKESKLEITLSLKLDKQGRSVQPSANNSLAALIKDSSLLSHNAYRLERSSDLMDIQNEIFRISRLEQKLKDVSGWKKPKDLESLAKLTPLKKVYDGCKDFSVKTSALEDNLLLAFYGKQEINKDSIIKEIKSLQIEWENVLLSTYALKFSSPNYVTLAFYSESPKRLFETAEMYFHIASNQEAETQVIKLTIDKAKLEKDKALSDKDKTAKTSAKKVAKTLDKPDDNFTANDDENDENNNKESKEKIPLKREIIKETKKFFKNPQDGIYSIVLGVNAPWAYLYYATESGSHVYLQGDSTEKWFIDSSEIKAMEYVPPVNIKRNTQAEVKKQSLRREWDHDKSLVEDMVLKKQINFYRGTMPNELTLLIKERLIKVATAIILHQE
ncbi:MAG: ATP-dependent Clp protease ATP-binding subunit [Acidobacteria bacterium]|nr:ATP-dependent Clp protease ATP-binding subunit [Acidobacteriota bacterium]